MKEVVIAGGSGFVGTHLLPMFLEKGYKVNILSREAHISCTQGVEYFKWDPDKGELPEGLIESSTYVLNLAGANLAAQRWTPAFKREIMTSRTNSTRTLVNAINQTQNRVEAFFCANAVGYYGFDRDKILVESDGPGDDFVSDVCINWQKEAEKLNTMHTRLLIYRIGIVLSPDDAAMKKMTQTIKWYIGAPLGTGKQVVPWIHIEDLCSMIIWGLENKLKGVYNAVGPEPVENRTLMKAIAKTLHRPLWPVSVPKFMLKLMLGGFVKSVTGSFPVSADKILQAGYKFKNPELHSAIRDLIRKYD